MNPLEQDIWEHHNYFASGNKMQCKLICSEQLWLHSCLHHWLLWHLDPWQLSYKAVRVQNHSASRANPVSSVSSAKLQRIITFMTLSNLPHNPISTLINIDKLIACSFVVVIFTTIWLVKGYCHRGYGYTGTTITWPPTHLSAQLCSTDAGCLTAWLDAWLWEM